MRVNLRISLPNTAEGDNQLAELVDHWLNGDGQITIATANSDISAELTYVKEQ